jgi:hypothetical protein
VAKLSLHSTNAIAASIQNPPAVTPIGNIQEFAMLTRYFLSSILLLSVFACSVTLDNKPAVAQSASQPISLNFKLPTGKRYRVAVTRDDTVSKNAKPYKIKIIGVKNGTAVILVDTYHSIPGGMSYCQAGSESFLRVISITAKQPTETFHTKLESCLDNIELASPGIEWEPNSSAVVIH